MVIGDSRNRLEELESNLNGGPWDLRSKKKFFFKAYTGLFSVEVNFGLLRCPNTSGRKVQRSMYKDLIRLLVPDPTSTYLTNQHLKTKGELEFLGDKLLEGGQLGEMKNGINYREDN
ncbi:uncharacterized protein LOC116302242 [Actinia tenebrosa]|uniref:Uncharacterized protein LOC116302242 n=1 Tax=Actinia tenebrosa TaxID=6105 RepID=A0A6P8IKZ3_ACTTE|nr:uncharacterized protein LOC116302242 [Actinia tenebrosa]